MIDDRRERERFERVATLVSRLLTESIDVSAAVLTSIDLQTRILAHLEDRPQEDLADEVSAALRARRRELLRELDAWSDSVMDSHDADTMN